MSLLHGSFSRRLVGVIILVALIADVSSLALFVDPVSASPGLALKWSWPYGSDAKTFIGALAANLVGDSKLEIVVVGGSADYASDGTVRVLNGTTGGVIWSVRPYDPPNRYWGGVGSHTPFEIVDLDKDGVMEIVISSTRGAMALHGNDGSLYWFNKAAPAEENYLAVADVDGNGYPEVFVSRGYGPYNGYDWITSLSYDGRILRQAWAWHPCWGGLTIGDANFDGKFELYLGDRSSTYVGERDGVVDPYKGGGMGIAAFDAETLTPLWSDPTVLCSSHAPMLADVDKDGILDVIVGDQGSQGIAVLNSADGSVLTTGGKYRKTGTYMPVHSQPTVYDVDGDGNLEFISGRNSQPKIWDLYSWKLDATLPVTVNEPPKLGDVTGDGKMDIIAVTSFTQDVYIYSYDSASATYKEVEHLVDWRLVNANAFTLVQDTDGDGYNELVLTGGDGRVTAYDTPAPAPIPRARTVNHFYSERRLGAAEYVPSPVPRVFNPPTQGNPSLVSSGGTDGDDENLIAKNQSTIDLDGDSVTNIYRWSVNDTSWANLLLPFDTRPTRAGTVLSDGFELGFGNWDGNGATDWDLSTVEKHSGQYSAHAGDADNFLISDSIDASSAASITVSFWYRDHGIDDNDNVYLQFWNNSGDPTPYNNIFELGNTGPEDTWHYYSVWFRTILWYQISDFRIRFDAHDLDSGEDLWIDDVTITLGDSLETMDYSGYNNKGTLHKSVWRGDGVVGGAIQFKGSDYITVHDSSSLGGDGTWDSMTIEFWIRPTESRREMRILAKKTWGNILTGSSYMAGFTSSASDPSNTLFWGALINSNWVSVADNPGTVISANKWSHVVLTYKSGDGLKIYVNGTVKASKSVSGYITPMTAQPGDENVYIGYDGGGTSVYRYFRGLLDEVRIYRRALTPEQIVQRFTESKGGLSMNSTMVSQETMVGDVWKVEVTPSDSYVDGVAKTSNTLTVFPNRAPVIDSYFPPDNPEGPEVIVGGSLEFTQTSHDPDGDSLTYSWLLDSVVQAATQNWTFVAASTGAYNVTLVVSDVAGLHDTQQWQVTVYLYMDGFESGDFSKWSGTFATSGETATVVNTQPYDGTYGGMFTGDGEGVWGDAYSYLAVSSASDLYARGYFKVASSGIADDNDRFFFLIFKAGEEAVAYAGWWRVNGVVRWALLIRDGTGGALAFSDSSPVAGQWYSVELHWVSDSVAGLGELYVNAELVASITGKNTAAFGGASLIRFGLAELYSCAATTVYGDSFIVSDEYIGIELPQDGFESGDFSRWSGVVTSSGETATIVNTMPYDGTYSAMFSGDGEGVWGDAYSYLTIPSTSELYARGYFRVTSSGIADDNDRFFFLIFKAGEEAVAYAGWWRVNGVVRWALLIRDGTGGAVAFSDSSPALNQWYSVELHWVSDSTAGLGELYVNGELVAQISGKNTGAFGGVNLIRFGLAELYSCAATTVYGDSFVTSEQYIGPEP